MDVIFPPSCWDQINTIIMDLILTESMCVWVQLGWVAGILMQTEYLPRKMGVIHVRCLPASAGRGASTGDLRKYAPKYLKMRVAMPVSFWYLGTRKVNNLHNHGPNNFLKNTELFFLAQGLFYNPTCSDQGVSIHSHGRHLTH